MYAPLMEFLAAAAPDTDFFCLQEIFDSPEKNRTVSWGGRAAIYQDLCATLPNFTPYYAIAVRDFDGDEYLDFPLSHGSAIFAKKNIPILSHGDFFIAGEDWHGPDTSQTPPHKLQYVRFEKNGAPYTLANVHGIAFPGTKRDTPERIAQSQKIVDFLAAEAGEKILGGDFNLMPNTESIRMIERAGPVVVSGRPDTMSGQERMSPESYYWAGLRNLITDFRVPTTRNQLSYGQYPEAERQYFADFAFVSPAIRVIDFQVPQIEISDHLPLILECEKKIEVT